MSNGWNPHTLGDLVELEYGRSLPESARRVGQVPVYGSNGKVGAHNEALIAGPGIIVGRKGSVGAVTFSSAAFWPIDTTFYVVRKRDDDWWFLYFLLLHSDLSSLNSHSAVPGLNRESVYSLHVRVPALRIQQVVSAILRLARRAILVQEQLVATMRELKQAAMRQLYTCGLRGEPQKETEIGLVPESWDVVPLGKHLTAAQYGLSLRGKEAGDYPILRMNCQVDGRVHFRDLQFVDLPHETADAFRLRRGDLLFNRTNSHELVGRTAIFRSEREAVFASYLIRLSLDETVLQPEFINYFFNIPSTQVELKKFASRGVSQSNISASKLRDFLIPRPPSLAEQQDMSRTLDAIDRKVEFHERKRATLQDLFKTLLNELMTGRIRTDDIDIDLIGSESALAASAQV